MGTKTRTGNSRGFTLVETLVATFVLVTAIVAPLTMVARGIFFSNYARDQVTASYLAQEALELVRNSRDNATLSGSSWSSWGLGTLNPCFVTVNQYGCSIDVSTNPVTISACSSANCGTLSVNSVSGLYGYQSGANWSPTPYQRKIKIYNEPVSNTNSDEIRVEVELLWNQGVISKNFVVREDLLNWQ